MSDAAAIAAADRNDEATARLLRLIIEAAHGFQEVVAQAVDGDYGIVHFVLPIQREGWCPSGREDTVIEIGSNLGYLSTGRLRENDPHYHQQARG